jgi:hypothetical protein
MPKKIGTVSKNQNSSLYLDAISHPALISVEIGLCGDKYLF